MAPWIPLVGLGLGGLLTVVQGGLMTRIPDLVRGGLVTSLWLLMTGGLHIDGVADAADGLAVDAHQQEGLSKRLAVMSDSRVGAFGVVAVVIVILLKTVTLASLDLKSIGLLTLIPAWGRWGQLVAIGSYPYLKPQGQGRLLKDTTRWPQDLWPMTPGLVLVTGGVGILTQSPSLVLLWTLGSAGIAWGVGYWLNQTVHGHTGDTYGATVEWTEVLILVLTTALFSPD